MGQATARRLIELSHSETPWKNSWEIKNNSWKADRILHDDFLKYYSKKWKTSMIKKEYAIPKEIEA